MYLSEPSLRRASLSARTIGWVIEGDLAATEAQIEVEGKAKGRIIILEQFYWARGGERCLQGRIESISTVLDLLDIV